MITVLQDARLTEVVAQHKAQGWERMAEFMGDGLRADQCRHRWDDYLEPRQKGLKRGNWQPDEVLHPYYCTCSSIYWHRTAQSLLLTYLYMAGAALADAGAPVHGHDAGPHKLDGHRLGAG